MPTYSTTPFARRVEKPWGYEIIWTPDGCPRTGKLLFVRAGKRLSYQYHDEKEETICLLEGEALLWLEDSDGVIRKVPMEPRAGYTVLVGQKHRIEGVKDALLAEVSDPERGNTFRIEDDYSRGTETEDIRREERSAGPED